MQFLGFLVKGVVAGAKAVGSAITGGAGGSAAGLTTLQKIGTAVSVVSQIGGGIARMNAAEAQARDLEFQANEEFITGRETSAALKMELARTVADQRVLAAASGVDLSSVSSVEAQDQATRDAERELGIASNNALARNLQRRRSALAARSSGRGALVGGFVGAGQTLINSQLDTAGRG